MPRIICFIMLVALTSHSFGQSRDPLQPVSDTTYFIYEREMRYIGSSTNIDPHYQYVLDHLVELMNKNPQWKLEIRGHVCCGPSEKVSTKRAKKVYNFLIDQGIHETRMSYKGYSDTMPAITPEKTEEDEAANRRVDFVIIR